VATESLSLSSAWTVLAGRKKTSHIREGSPFWIGRKVASLRGPLRTAAEEGDNLCSTSSSVPADKNAVSKMAAEEFSTRNNSAGGKERILAGELLAVREEAKPGTRDACDD